MHCCLLKRRHRVLPLCVKTRFFIAVLSCAASRSSLRWSVLACHALLFPSPFFPLVLVITKAGFGRGWSSACTSLRIFVSSRSASSSVHPSPCRVAISFHRRRSACKSSVVVTVRRPESGAMLCVARSYTFLSNARNTRRSAPPHMAIALLNSLSVLASHAGFRYPLSID